ncbi:hypothetical protein F503_05342 [Ophiostoma piceae UAMH 11346]|uniref:AMP-activated protein kinase glycogen-binding domain-containing protein n=1 Tax=Ophiostoma piceae (strain UAMH 11346) TaxID=1262450 RepID=S3CBI9_OPHP1|nr:hypothetical protein F503_05342 [Ophiostoma piceae UAMH 11346]
MDMNNTANETVEITYRSTDLLPPLFLAGSFSSPPWTPLEMKHHKTTSGEHIFTQTIHVKPGTTVQYKFRVGLGDSWVLDETLPISSDEMGNRNNVLKIGNRESHSLEGPPTPPPDSPRAPHSAFQRSDMSSLPGTSTPDFVRTTLEVADTAAQIDPRTPEPKVSDEEAGRIGYRRLSSTPIAEVADTAAEVADAVEEVDFDDIDDIEVDIGPDFSHELAGEEDNGQDEAPVFAYEFAGGGFDRAQSFSGSEYSPGTYPTSGLDDGDGRTDRFNDEIDTKDPTLERFPSNREGIFQKVRTLETGLTEDIPTFDGFPASPVVSAGRKSSADINGEPFSISPATAAAHLSNWPQNDGNGYHQDSRKRSASKGSTVGEPSPSLQCIMEENPLDEEDEAEGALLSMPIHPKKVGLTSSYASLMAAAPPLPPVRHTSQPDTAPSIIVHTTDDASNSNSGDGVSRYSTGRPQ